MALTKIDNLQQRLPECVGYLRLMDLLRRWEMLSTLAGWRSGCGLRRMLGLFAVGVETHVVSMTLQFPNQSIKHACMGNMPLHAWGMNERMNGKEIKRSREDVDGKMGGKPLGEI